MRGGERERESWPGLHRRRRQRRLLCWVILSGARNFEGPGFPRHSTLWTQINELSTIVLFSWQLNGQKATSMRGNSVGVCPRLSSRRGEQQRPPRPGARRGCFIDTKISNHALASQPMQDALLEADEAPERRKKREKRDWGWGWRELSKLKHALLDLGATSKKNTTSSKSPHRCWLSFICLYSPQCDCTTLFLSNTAGSRRTIYRNISCAAFRVRVRSHSLLKSQRMEFSLSH